MSGDAVRVRTVSVRLRRVAAGRAVQRLLVLGGLLIAGWLLGCAAQSATAHADELPAPARVVARTPVLGRAAAAVHERVPVHRVVRAVTVKVPRTAPDEALPQVAPPAQSVEPVRAAPRAVERSAPRARHDAAPRASRNLPVRVAKASATRPVVGHAPHHAVRHPALPAPRRHGDHSAAGGYAAGGLTAGFPASVSWASAPSCASAAHVLGAMPPAVRTAADEPSFVPD